MVLQVFFDIYFDYIESQIWENKFCNSSKKTPVLKEVHK